MSLGLRNAVLTFQCFMDEILKYLDFFIAYLDDILFFGLSPQEHDKRFRTLCTKLQTYVILIKPAKCDLRDLEISFLGCKITTLGSQPTPKQIPHLQACPPAKTVS